nr:glycosyltransferase family 1 protein [Vicinamibacteria bacterium]
SLNELFTEGAVVVEPEPSAVATAIDAVLDTGAFREDLIRRGAAHARTFSWERTAAETLAVLEGAAS